MSTYMTPGVYVEEIPARNKPIEGVSTSIAAFIGLAPGGPLNRPVLISDWSQFERLYSDPDNPDDGPYMENAYLAYAVRGFFANQGTQCWVVRVGGVGAPRVALPTEGRDRKIAFVVTARSGVEEPVQMELKLDPPRLAPGADGDAEAAAEGAAAEKAAEEDKPAEEDKAAAADKAAADETAADETAADETAADKTAAEAKPAPDDAAAEGDKPAVAADARTPPPPPEPTYTVVLRAGNAKPEEHGGLTIAQLKDTIDNESHLVTMEAKLESLEGLKLVANTTYRLSAEARRPAEVDAGEIEGDISRRSGLGGLAAIEEISIVCAPDIMAVARDEDGKLDDGTLRKLQGKLITHCEAMNDRVAVLDTPPDLTPETALDWRLNQAGYDFKQATLYYPWLEVTDPLTKFPKLVPPCGHVAGVWARTDRTRGVHKAPANEAIMDITGLGFRMTDVEQGNLNRSGLNCIRAFRGRGIRVWGARTLSYEAEWRYLNVRRLFNFISDSIMRGTQWAVFEPNDERLWMQLQINVSNFLMIAWRSGALFGATPEQAFYVKCDAETNPPESVEQGLVVTEVGIAPVKPAEFVVFRINQYTAGEGAA